MKRKIIIAGLIFSFCYSTPSNVMAAEIVNVNAPAEAYIHADRTERADLIDYVYKIIDGKLYKRLYNFTQEKWVGDWILA